jgi:hypothetical protein
MQVKSKFEEHLARVFIVRSAMPLRGMTEFIGDVVVRELELMLKARD